MRCIQKTEQGTAIVHDNLSKESPKLVDRQKELEDKLEEYAKRKTILGQKIKTIFEDEAEFAFKLEEARRIRTVCERNFKDVIPVLNQSIAGLQKIKKHEIDEIKSYKNPTPTLRTLMQAVCIVLRVSPTVVRDKQSHFKPRDDYWVAALGPQVLGDKNIMKVLSSVEPKALDA